jgi:hypothetical protein
MRIIKISSIILLSITLCFGQKSKKELKTGTGEFCYGTDYCGTETYHYYIDPVTSEQVYEGPYKASGKSNSDIGFASFLVTGQYRHGRMDGVWKFNRERKNVPLQGGGYSTGFLRCTKSYKNGVANGKWSIREIWKARNMIIYSGKPLWGHFNEPSTDSACVYFKNGVAYGTIYLQNYNEVSTTKLTQNGLFISDSKSEQYNSHGLITTLNDVKTDTTLLRYGNQFLEGKISKSRLDELKIKVDTVLNDSEPFELLFKQDFLFGGNDEAAIKAYGRCFYVRYLTDEQ